jgi:two-component system KDP operon response regulator KdpE
MAAHFNRERSTLSMSIRPDKVLIVAKDASLYFNLRKTLEDLEFDCGEAASGDAALIRLRMVDYDAVLLDIRGSSVGWIEACRQIRGIYPRLPVLVLGDCDCVDNKVDALEAGADDYISKPFSAREIIARLRSAIRRFRTPVVGTNERFVVGEITLDPAKRRVEKSGSQVLLTPLEFRTLQTLMEQAGRPVSHTALLATLWGKESRQHRYHLRVIVGVLRKKLEDDPSHPTYLITHSCFGYCFRDR